MSDEYIRKADAKDALQEKVFHNLTDEFYGAMQAIDELPSADVVQVVHGKWISGKYTDDDLRYNDYSYRCNRCGKIVDFAENYCPRCGAKMDKGD